jgi:hypothetical protein
MMAADTGIECQIQGCSCTSLTQLQEADLLMCLEVSLRTVVDTVVVDIAAVAVAAAHVGVVADWCRTLFYSDSGLVRLICCLGVASAST